MIQKTLTAFSFAYSECGKPFEWGLTNCGMLAARLYDKLEGGSFWRKQAINYSNNKESLNLYKNKSVYNLMIDNGFKKIDSKHLSIGDLIYAYKDGLECLHIYYGKECLSSTESDGVGMIDTKKVLNDKNAICMTKEIKCPQ